MFWNSLIADLMKQKFQKTSVRLVFVSLFFIAPMVLLIGCGDVEPVTAPPPPEVAEISNILKNRWKLGYETESLDLYVSSFWKEGFFYWSDMATKDNIGDDVAFDSWDQERKSAIKVFKDYRNIEIEISEPPEVKILDDAKTKAEVRNHYKIQLYVPEGTSLPGGYEAYYAEGDQTFIFERRANDNGKMEWRITEWRQNEYGKEQIEVGLKQ